jgi:hypothetical protein
MTNQEAINELQSAIDLIKQDGKDWFDERDIPILEMAIKALKAQDWVSVNKKSHPDTPERVQVQLDNGWIITAYYEENEWLSVPDYGAPIKDRWIEAWRPLPEPYREDGD